MINIEVQTLSASSDDRKRNLFQALISEELVAAAEAAETRIKSEGKKAWKRDNHCKIVVETDTGFARFRIGGSPHEISERSCEITRFSQAKLLELIENRKGNREALALDAADRFLKQFLSGAVPQHMAGALRIETYV